MFSALRQGALIYILDKGEKPGIKIGQVEGVTQPRFSPGSGFGTIVDIAVKVDNEKKDFVGVPSNVSIHEYGNIVISESREQMIQEIHAMLRTSQSILDSVEYHKNMTVACEEMLKQIDPDYAKQQERDSALDSLKDEVGSLKDDVSSLKGNINQILNLLTKAKTDNT